MNKGDDAGPALPPVGQDEGEAPFAPSPDSVGIVEARSITLPGRFRLEGGRWLDEVTVAYETYGRLNQRRDNAILLCHALSGDAHAAGYLSERDRRPGWWDTMVGPGKAFDTERYFVICSNVLGGCRGTTGPSSLAPETGHRYGGDFPVVTIGDMVRVQALLLDQLGIEQLAGAAGGSMGGMQVLEWAARHPGRLRAAIVLAAAARLTAQALAFNEAARQAIIGDPRWRGGHYPPDDPPAGGLAAARMIGHLTYLSASGMERRFGRGLQDRAALSYSFDADFQVESYLRHQAESFVRRFDANSYLYITRAMDYFDLGAGAPSLAEALRPAMARFLIVSVDSDWLYPTSQGRELTEALTAAGKATIAVELSSPHGHDAFLLEHRALTPQIGAFLAEGAGASGF